MKHLIWLPVSPVRLEDIGEYQRINIAENIITMYRRWKTSRRYLEEVWHQIDRHVEQYDPQYTPTQRSEMGYQIQMPHSFGSKLKMVNVYSHREGIVSAMMRYLMANEYDFFDVTPFDVIDTDAASAIKLYMMYLYEQMDLESDFTLHCRDIVQYGTGFASYEWHRTEGPRWKREYTKDPGTEQEMEIDFEAQDILYNAPKLSTLDPFYTLVDPVARDLRTATIIFKKPEAPHDILANQSYDGVSEQFLKNAPDFLQSEDSNDAIQREYTRQGGQVSITDSYRGKKEVYEAWGDFTDNNKTYRNYVAEIIGGRLIRFEPNPYNMPHKPFIISRYCPETGRVYGRSALATIVGIQAAFDTVVNQYMDYWNLEINRPLLVQGNTIVRRNRENRTGPLQLPPISKDAAWDVRDVNGIKRLDWGGKAATMNPVPILTLLGSQMERATGDSELNSGGSAKPYVKTGVALSVADAGSSRFNLYAKTIERESIIPILSMTIDLLRQQDIEPRTFNRKDRAGNEEVQFDPAVLANDIRFTLRGASYNSQKANKLQLFQQFFQFLSSNPITLQLTNWGRAVMMIGELLDIRNVRELLRPEAIQLMDTSPRQPGFFQQVAGLFGGNQNGQPQPQQPASVGAGDTGLAVASGGAIPGGGAPSPFDNTSQPG